MRRIKAGAFIFLIFVLFEANSQGLIGSDTTNRVITTAVPFMTIGPDARSGGMGDVGVAISPDANTIHWNVAKLALIEDDIGFSLSYTPWLTNLGINDMSISFLSGYMRINKEQTVGIALRYFDLGDFQFTDDNAQIIQDFNPREFSFEGSYSRLLSKNMTIGITLKFIYSNLTGNVFTSTDESQAGTSFAGDLGWYWNKDINLIGANTNLALGATITNIGAKMTYSNDAQKEFIPTNLRIGSTLTTELDPYNKFSFSIDMNKLMVPTPPIYEVDENGNIVYDQNGDPVIRKGKDPDRGLISGMFGSFADAPDGFPEEIHEMMWSFGLEYWYNNTFAARTGYFHEHKTKGNRKYFTFGLGFRYNVFGIDFAYLVPTQYNHPLAETLRFSLHFDFNKNKPAESVTDQN